MVQRQGRGVGSNQWRERIVTVEEDERKAAARAQYAHLAVPAPDSTPQGAVGGQKATFAEVARQHQEAVDSHLSFALDAPPEMTESEHRERLRAGVESVAASEDRILSRQPNLYGQALISANNFLVRHKHDPVLRRAVEEGDKDAVRVLSACERLLRDSEDQSLGVEGISQAMSDLEGGGEWSAMRTDDAASPNPAGSEDTALCRRAAALSVASSRASSPEERADIMQEMQRTNKSLRALRLNSLGG